MRTLSRNKQTIYYALYHSKTDVIDEFGNKTGEYTLNYEEPVKLAVNVSAARGTSDIEQFGMNANYSKTIVTDDVNCPICETTRLWVGRDTDLPHNYVVTMVARSINSVTYAIKEVVVS